VIFLKNGSAKDFATLLSQLVQGKNTAARAAGATEVRPAGSPPPAPNAAPAAPIATVLTGADTSEEFSPFLTILPEERSNALIVAGTEQDITQIRQLVERIDILLAQVRIEVVIAEVTLTDAATSGINTLGLKIVNDKLVGFNSSGAGFSNISGVFTNAADGSTQLSADIALVTTPRKNNTVILSVPTIITTHNKEANIFVGEQRPVISSYLNDAGGGSTIGGSGYRSTVTSKDIGIELTVKPLIGNDGSVQLEITQEVNDVLGEILIDGNEQPRIGRRATKSFISVKSGETIVLGGLQRHSKTRSTNRLGPIPIIGDLLGSRSRDDTRTDLVFFLRPYVLTQYAGGQRRRVAAGRYGPAAGRHSRGHRSFVHPAQLEKASGPAALNRAAQP